MGMFDFLFMAGNYEDRKVARSDFDWGFVSTCYVNDAAKPYETAVKHPEYNDGRVVIVETYNTENDAQAGHDRWVATMTADVLPDRLVDRGEAELAQMVDIFSDDNEWRIRPRTVKTTEAD